jgi:hypothetical protein
VIISILITAVPISLVERKPMNNFYQRFYRTKLTASATGA